LNRFFWPVPYISASAMLRVFPYVHAYYVVLLLVLLPCERATRVRSRLHVIGDKAREEAIFTPSLGIRRQAARLAVPARPAVGPLGILRNGTKGFRGAMANQVALPLFHAPAISPQMMALVTLPRQKQTKPSIEQERLEELRASKMALPLLAPAAARSSAASVRMYIPREERIQSAKAGAVAALSGSLPPALFVLSTLISYKTFTLSTWALSSGLLAVELFFFGLLYRLAIREDDNDELKQTVVVAFALFRAFGATQVGSKDTLLQVAANFGESLLAFSFAAFALDYVWKRGIAFPCPPKLPPSYDSDFDRFRDYNRRDYPPWY